MSERKRDALIQVIEQFSFVSNQMDQVIESCSDDTSPVGIKKMADMERYSATMNNLMSTIDTMLSNKKVLRDIGEYMKQLEDDMNG